MNEPVDVDELIADAHTGKEPADDILDRAAAYLKQEHGENATEQADEFATHDIVGTGLYRMSEDRVQEWTKELETLDKATVDAVRDETDESHYEGTDDPEMHVRYFVAQKATGRLLEERL